MLPQSRADTDPRNAAVSTGPRDTSVTRLNALKHGILAREVVAGAELGIESREEFENLRVALQSQLHADEPLALVLVDQLAALAWRWRRVIRYETAAIESAVADVRRHLASSPDDPESEQRIHRRLAFAALPGEAHLDKITRYEAHISRQFHRTLAELRSLQACRIESGRPDSRQSERSRIAESQACRPGGA